MLSKVRVGRIDDAEKLLKARFLHASHENYPKDPLRMYAEKKNGLSGEIYTKTDDKIPDN